MFKLPDISKETEIVKNMLTDDREGYEIAKDYGIGTKLLNERMRNQRTFWLNMKEMSNEDIVDAINTIGGSIAKQARWFKLSPNIFRNNIFETLMTDEEFTKMYTKDNSLPEDFSEKIGIPNFILRETMKRRAKRLKVHRDKTFHPSMMQRRFYNDEDKVREAQCKREATMLERYGVRIPLKNKSIKRKVIKTVKERYGSTTFLTSDKFKSLNIKNTKSNGREEKEAISLITSKLLKNHMYEYNIRYPFLDNQEFDLLVDNKFAVEFNGIYWHSTEHQSRINQYHFKKYDKAKNNDITMISIWEPEWRHDKYKVTQDVIRIIEPEQFLVKDIENAQLDYISNNTIFINDGIDNIASLKVINKSIVDIRLKDNIILQGSWKYLMDKVKANKVVINNDKGNFSGLSLENLYMEKCSTHIIKNFMNSGYDVEPSGYTLYETK